MRNLWLFLHLVGIVIWVGGMFFAQHCLRPAAAGLLEPPQRLPLLSATLGKFFDYVLLALALLWASGLAMLAAAGFKGAPIAWHLMAGIALVMTVIFAVIRWQRYPVLEAAVAAKDWPAGAAAMNGIRRLVAINLGLGFLTIAVATIGASLK